MARGGSKAAVKHQHNVLAASFGKDQHAEQSSEYKHHTAEAQHEVQAYNVELKYETRPAGKQQHKAYQQSRSDGAVKAAVIWGKGGATSQMQGSVQRAEEEANKDRRGALPAKECTVTSSKVRHQLDWQDAWFFIQAQRWGRKGC